LQPSARAYGWRTCAMRMHCCRLCMRCWLTCAAQRACPDAALPCCGPSAAQLCWGVSHLMHGMLTGAISPLADCHAFANHRLYRASCASITFCLCSPSQHSSSPPASCQHMLASSSPL
jgi:hypothetical protein